MDRYLKQQISQDLKKKMVFLGGPRQVGKTTLAKSIEKNYLYYNWDIDAHREAILTKQFSKSPLWIFDEIHKYRTWRNYLKGVYDEYQLKQKILVTGSAQLDSLRKGGDSLQGRYFYLRLHPLSMNELNISTQKQFEELVKLGGFPEPFFSSSSQFANRWSRNYRERLIRQEVPANELIQDLGNMELLFLRLPDTVGSTLSINSMREDLQLAHKTVHKWIEALERLYAVFCIAPFGAPLIKAIKKERKLYFFDWNLVSNEAARFENCIACHLLKWVHYQQDVEGKDIELRYFRNTLKQEVDFVICEKNNPILFVECKTSDTEISGALVYLKKKYPQARAYQIYLKGKKEYLSAHGISVEPAYKFLKEFI